MAKKHLVLDYDVHLRLKSRKRSTGIPQQSIGNMILRSVLSQPDLLIDAVGKKLADLGTIEPEEYSNIVRDAIQRIERTAAEGSTLVAAGSEDMLVAGSWKIRPLYRCPDGSFQVIEVMARNARKEPISYHIHNEDEYMLVLAGCVMLEDTGRHLLLDCGSSCRIQHGSAHSATPLGGDVRALVTFVPASPLFPQSSNTGR